VTEHKGEYTFDFKEKEKQFKHKFPMYDLDLCMCVGKHKVNYFRPTDAKIFQPGSGAMHAFLGMSDNSDSSYSFL